MDATILARLQFAVTVGFHFIFPPITIGLSWFVFFALTRYIITKRDLYRSIAHFWSKILAIGFAVGVATGITMEFQFGTNWGAYARYVGDIFGAPLAAETIFSFFLESTFLVILLFGWKRLSPKVLWTGSFFVAFGATLSAFWILAANSWQQTPAGFEIVNGRAQLTDFWEAILNHSTLERFTHTMNAALITGSLFLISISAIMLMWNRSNPYAQQTMRMGLYTALVAAVLQFPLGHYHAVQVVNTQPAKLAAFEAHFRTEKPAYQVLLGIPDEENMEVHYAIRVPKLLSFLAYGNLTAEVRGLEEHPREEWPPVAATFLSFRLMVLLGILFFILPLWGVVYLGQNKEMRSKAFLWAAAIFLPLPTLANQLGWITAEVGRQPWAVWHLLRTSNAVSANVTAGEILFSLIVFSLYYLTLFCIWLFVLWYLMKKGYPVYEKETPARPLDSEVTA